MTTKVNGAAYPGVWVERKVAFVKLTFSVDIAAIPQADLTVLGTATPVVAGGTGASAFGVVESVLVQALKNLETRATVLAISNYDATAQTVDIMLGNAEGWFAPATNGVIATALPVVGAQAVQASGTLVSVAAGAVTFDMQFAAFGNLPNGTGANGTLVSGPGATPGSSPMNSPTGTAGWYPASI